MATIWVQRHAGHSLLKLVCPHPDTAPSILFIQKLERSLGNMHPEGDKQIVWLDVAHLGCKHGHKVFNQEEMAVNELEKITDASIMNEANEAIELLVGADRLLALTAIIEAPDGKNKDKAKQEFQKSEAETQNKKKIDGYRKAWKHLNTPCEKEEDFHVEKMKAASPGGDILSIAEDKVGHLNTAFADGL